MNKNLTIRFFFGILALCLLSINTSTAQCLPAGPVAVSGVADANAGLTYSFTGVPVGTVIQLVTAQADDVFNIELCATNATGWLDGDHDSSLHILDANSATANYLQGIEDGCTGFAAGEQGWGPDVGVWGATAIGTYYLYITEWDAAGAANCEVTSGQTYQIDITIASAGPCDAGNLTSPLTQNVCPTESFSIITDGTEVSDGGFELGIDNSNTAGTGGTGGGIRLINLTAADLPLIFDQDLNGILSSQATPLPVLEGTWEMKLYALDATGADCDSTVITVVNFLAATDAACAGGATPCTVLALNAGPYVDMQVPPCDLTCGTPVAPGYEVWGNEGYLVNATAGSEYTVEFCTGYDAATWPATITVAEWDGTNPGTILGVVDGCSLTFTTPNTGEVIIYVSVTGDCGGVYNQTDNGAINIDCGPNGATCPASVGCIADDWTNANPLNICDGTFETLSVGATSASDGGFELAFDDSQGGTGAIAGGFTFAPGLPYDLDAGLGGVLAAQVPALPDMGGTWLVTYYALDVAGIRCDSTSVLTVNFLPSTDPACGATATPCTQFAAGGGPFIDFAIPPCGASCGTPVAPAFEVFGNEAYTVTTTAGSEYVFEFCTGYDANTWPATITVAEWDGVNPGTILGVVDGCSLTFTTPNDGDIIIYVSVTGDCGGAYNQVDNGAPTLDCGPNGATCPVATVCEADDWTNANPLDICEGTSEALTLGGTENADGGFEIAFDDSQGGTGALAGGFNFTGITYPFDLNEGLSGVLAANGVANLGGTWLLTGYALDAAGVRCDSTSVLTVNFLPASNPNCGTPVCEADDWTNLGPISVCAGEAEIVTLGATADSGGGFQLDFDDSQGGTGGLAGGFFIGADFPYSLDETLNNLLPDNGIANLAGTWLVTAYAIDVSGVRCDSTSVLTVIFLDANDPLCSDPCLNTTINIDLLASEPITCNGTSDGAIAASPSGGTVANDYSYTWSTTPVQTTSTAIGLAAGTYTVTATDDNSCSATASITIENPAELLVDLIESTDVSCNNSGDGTASVITTGGTGNYVYAWSTTPAQTTPTATGLSAGTYTITATDDNSCSATVSVTITEPTPIFVSIDNITNANCGDNSGVIGISASGGAGGYTYVWSNGMMVQDLSGLTADTYTVIVTDMNGCTTSAMAEVMSSISTTALTVAASSTDDNCGSMDGTAIVDSVTGGSGNYTYAWSNGETTASVSGLAAGSYPVTVTDGDTGCSGVGFVNVGSIGGPTVTVDNVTGVTCNGDEDGFILITVTGGNNNSYQWSNGETTEDINGLSGGAYTGTITSSNGCEFIVNATITEPTAINISINDITNVSCSGTPDGSIDLSITGGSGNYTYLWSNGATSEDLANLSDGGTYTIEVTDVVSACVYTSSASIVNDISTSALTVSTSATGENCGSGDGTAVIDNVTGGSGTYSYVWSNGETTASISGLSAGSYPVTVTDDVTGCSGTGIANIESIGGPTVTIDNVVDVTCNGDTNGAIMITSNANIYEWSNGETTEDLSGLAPGNYTGTITAENGCSFVVSATVAEPTSIEVSTAATGENCGSVDGTASAYNVTGGAGNYSYLWSNGETTASISGLIAGSYEVIVTDASGCTGLGMTSVESIGGPDVIIDNLTNINCNGEANGSIMITGINASSYAWSNGETTEDIADLSPGNYTCTVSSVNGCEFILTATITEPLALVATVDDVVGSTGADGSVSISVTGGIEIYTYAWSNGETTEDISTLAPGDYTCTITDMNGCTTEVSANVSDVTPVEDINEITSFSLTPNPTTGNVRIEMNLSNSHNVELQLFDITGRTLVSTSKNNTSQAVFDLDLNTYADGVYFAKFIVDGNSTFTERIIKTH